MSTGEGVPLTYRDRSPAVPTPDPPFCSKNSTTPPLGEDCRHGIASVRAYSAGGERDASLPFP